MARLVVDGVGFEYLLERAAADTGGCLTQGTSPDTPGKPAAAGNSGADTPSAAGAEMAGAEAAGSDASGVAGAPGGGRKVRGTVVLLNGIAMTIAHWKPVASRLAAAGWQVLMHDMRGQMLSDRPAGPYSLELHARDLAALMDALGIQSAHIVGTSYGSEVALTFARDFPTRTESVVPIDGVTEYDAVLGAAVESWKAAALSNPRVFYKILLPWTYSPAYLAANRDTLTRREDAIASLPADWFRAFADLCDAFLAIDLTGDLPGIRAPALVMVADGDILKHAGYSEIMIRGLPDARLVTIRNSGHAVVIEQPDAVADGLLAFFDGLATAQ